MEAINFPTLQNFINKFPHLNNHKNILQLKFPLNIESINDIDYLENILSPNKIKHLVHIK